MVAAEGRGCFSRPGERRKKTEDATRFRRVGTSGGKEAEVARVRSSSFAGVRGVLLATSDSRRG